MKRPAYVDENGNKINENGSLKHKLTLYFVIGTIFPIIILCLIFYQMYSNSSCLKVYNNIKNGANDYLEKKDKFPSFEGESVTVNVTKLYEERFLANYETNNTECSGSVKVTKYKDEYVYTIELENCKTCTTSKKYGKWSSFLSNYPKGKTIVDVIPYYNYYEVELGVTDWSKYYDDSELSDTIDETYKTRIPANDDLPTVPSDVKIIGLNTQQRTLYSYQDKTWKWYDIVGDYSDFSSEKPDGYAYKDTNTEKYSEWSEYSYSSPEEKEYRTIERKTAYKFYYLNDENKKIYYNNGKYSVSADRTKYPFMESETAVMFRYRDKVWRWYNGQKRNYSNYTNTPNERYLYKDLELYSLGANSAFKETSSLTSENSSYRVETKKVQTRFQIKYEVSSLPIYDTPLERETFLKRINTTIPKFANKDDIRVEVTYKFRYRKS